jgi:hypothetical protein
MGLDRFPLRAKIPVPIVLLALIALAISAFGATRRSRVDFMGN